MNLTLLLRSSLIDGGGGSPLLRCWVACCRDQQPRRRTLLLPLYRPLLQRSEQDGCCATSSVGGAPAPPEARQIDEMTVVLPCRLSPLVLHHLAASPRPLSLLSRSSTAEQPRPKPLRHHQDHRQSSHNHLRRGRLRHLAAVEANRKALCRESKLPASKGREGNKNYKLNLTDINIINGWVCVGGTALSLRPRVLSDEYICTKGEREGARAENNRGSPRARAAESAGGERRALLLPGPVNRRGPDTSTSPGNRPPAPARPSSARGRAGGRRR